MTTLLRYAGPTRSAWRMLLAVCGCLTLPLGAQQQVLGPCADSDKQCLQKAQEASPVAKLPYWEDILKKPVDQRIGPASSELIEYLTLDNRKDGIPNRPRAAALSPDFLADVQDALAEIPPQVKRLLTAKLAGIYFVDDLGGSGFTDLLLGNASAPVGFTVFDYGVLNKRTANEWATWRENTPFKPDVAYRLAANIETGAQNNRKNAIQYILLHELGHVIAIGGNLHPPWNIEAGKTGDAAGYPFYQLSWLVPSGENRYASMFDTEFPQRRDVVFYFGARLAGSEMPVVYRGLLHTNFATLYSTTSPGDDFAEAFANYVHVVLMKKPFEIRIYHDDRINMVYRSCWNEQRCLQKRKILEKLLSQD
jgi:hypothetical protein